MAGARVVAFGDRALRFPLSEGEDRRSLLASLRDVPGVADVVLAEDTGAVVLGDGAAQDSVQAAVASVLAATAASTACAGAPPPAHHVIRVVYDGDDLAEVAKSLGVRPGEVAALHADRDYEVAMLGFLPGFAYLRGLDARLVLPRRAQPRTRVPAGSVAIAAEYTGIYPFASPGGWNLLGRAVGPRLLDANGAALALGDRVRFERAEAVDLAEAPAALEEPARPRGAHLEVVKAHGPAIVVDGGRFGHMHEGVPHGGAMVPAALAGANRAAGNDRGAAALEVFGALEVVARGGSVTVADDWRGATVLGDGESFAIATEGRTRVRYLAILGGVDVPLVLGGRGTLLVAGLGGYSGRALKRGDRITSARATPSVLANASPSALASLSPSAGADIPLLVGPDAEDAVLDAIARVTFTIGARSDRIGTRLEGPALPPHSMQNAHERRSRPMVRGAVEITPSGLVVLGPDHPTTGGYPVVAVVPEGALGRLMGLPIGAPTRLAVARQKPT